MLTHVHIHHFAIIDSVELELHAGMTALTGETGAGKSILIDALSLAMGDRAGASVVRTGAKRAEIHLTLDIQRLPSVGQWLLDLELENVDNPHECFLRRTVNADGGSKAYINSRVVPLQQLRELTTQLVDIHGQHAHHLLLKSDTHRYLLDLFAKNKSLCQTIKHHYAEYKKLQQQLKQIIQNQENAHNQLALLSFQLQELEELSPQMDEWQQLSAEHQRLSHAESLINECENIISILAEGEPQPLINTLEKASLMLQKLKNTDAKLSDTAHLLESALIQIQEASGELRTYVRQLELNPQHLQHIDARLSKMHTLARKHRIKPEDLYELQQNIQQQLQQLQDPNDQITALEQSIQAHERDYKKAAQQLSSAREIASEKLNIAITAHMQTLGMTGGYFQVELTPHNELSEHGLEHIVFKVCTNPGHGAYPLHKIASGGELSRISLAIQVTTMQANDTIPIIVFDEVDVGIGGSTAEIVGRLLKQLGQNAQVLCVTHLPQVAAQADQHLYIAKSTDGQSTHTQITPLNHEARIGEIARMLGGVTLTEHTLAHAREMLLTEPV